MEKLKWKGENNLSDTNTKKKKKKENETVDEDHEPKNHHFQKISCVSKCTDKKRDLFQQISK